MRKYESKLRQEQAANTKRVIGDALQDLVVTKKLHDITIRELCQNAGVSVGSFYQYFGTREQAILYTYHVSDDFFDHMEFPPENGPMENIAAILRKYLYSVDLGRVNNIRQLYIAHLGYSDPYFFSKDRGLTRQLTAWVTAGREEGSLRGGETPDETVVRLLRFLRGLLYDLAIRTEYIDLSAWAETSCREAEEFLDIFRAN